MARLLAESSANVERPIAAEKIARGLDTTYIQSATRRGAARATMSEFDDVLFHVEVRETDKNRSYWANKPWASGCAQEIRRAEIVVVPWENFRKEHPAVFPQETNEILARLRTVPRLHVVVGIDRENFQEVSLHGRAWRWPTLFVTSVVLPIVVGVLTTE